MRAPRKTTGVGLLVCLLQAGAAVYAPASAAQDPEDFIEEITPGKTGEEPADDEPEPAPARTRTKPGARDRSADRRTEKKPKADQPSGGARLGAPGELDAEGADGIDLTPRSYAGLVERWDARLVAVQSGELAKERRAESELLSGTRAFGVQGAPFGAQALDFGRAYVHEARKASAVGDVERALALLDVAAEWAPSLTPIPAERARIALQHKTDVFGAISALTDAVINHATRSPEGQVRSLLVVTSGLIVCALFMLWLTALIVMWRTFPMLSYDILTILPRGAASWQVMVLVALLVVAPLVAGLGPVFTPLLWLTLAWVYLGKAERRAVVVVGLLTLALPLLLDVGARLFSYPTSPAAVRHGARLDVAAADLRAGLLTRPPEQLDVIELAALADAAYREGQLEVAKQLTGRLARRLPEAGWVKNDLGAIAGVTGRPEVAHAEFKAALAIDPQLVAAAFNLSVSALRDATGRLSVPQDASNLVTENVSVRERMREVTFQSGNRAVPHNQLYVRTAPRIDYALDAYRSPAPAALQMRDEWLGALFMGQSRDIAAGAAGGALLVWLLLTLFARKFEPSRPCERCGQASSPRYDAADVPAGTCASCFHVFYRSGQVDSKVQVRKERQVRDHRARRSRTARFLAVAFSGAGHLWLGRAGLALVASLLMAFTVGWGLAAWMMPRLGVMDTTLVDVAMWAPAALVALILYVLMVRDAFALSD